MGIHMRGWETAEGYESDAEESFPYTPQPSGAATPGAMLLGSESRASAKLMPKRIPESRLLLTTPSGNDLERTCSFESDNGVHEPPR